MLTVKKLRVRQHGVQQVDMSHKNPTTRKFSIFYHVRAPVHNLHGTCTHRAADNRHVCNLLHVRTTTVSSIGKQAKLPIWLGVALKWQDKSYSQNKNN